LTPANLLAEWSRLLIGMLRRAGVRDVIVSPGSRSTPFLVTALREPELRLRSVVDERDAAFFALGLARVTGEPALLLCTSGSAAANYFPAVVEARRAGVPLLLLTADRPLELHDADAPQTIDQTRLYGQHADFIELGTPDADAAALRGLVRSVARGVHLASATPGPVQLNARARKPLEPGGDESGMGRALRTAVDGLLERGPTLVARAIATPTPESLAPLVDACATAARGILVLGPMAPWRAPSCDAVERFLGRTGFALFAEATSQHRLAGAAAGDAVRVDAWDALLRSPRFLERFRPELVVQVGPPPTARAWHDWAARPDAPPRWVLNAPAWSDPSGNAAGLVPAPPAAALAALAAALPDGDRQPGRDAPPGDADWRAWLTRTDAAAWAALEALLADAPADSPMNEAAAVRAALDALPRDALLVVGNSLPVREVDTFVRGGDRGVTVLSQRGANGIDGLIAGAAGAAAAARRPTLLLLGDVSLLHDVGGLASTQGCDAPLAIVVIDNGGGRIFDHLPLARTEAVNADDWRYWSTPTRIDTAALARAFGLHGAAASQPGPAREIVGAALSEPGATLIRLVVDGDRTAPLHRELYAAVDAAVPAP